MEPNDCCPQKPRKIIRQKLFNLASPIFVETLLIMLTGAVDVFMLSRYSDETVAAGGVVNQLLNLVFILYGITTLGTSVLCAQYLGARQKKNVAQVIGVSLLANLLMGLAVSAGLFFFASKLFCSVCRAGINCRPDWIFSRKAFLLSSR